MEVLKLLFKYKPVFLLKCLFTTSVSASQWKVRAYTNKQRRDNPETPLGYYLFSMMDTVGILLEKSRKIIFIFESFTDIDGLFKGEAPWSTRSKKGIVE